MWWQQRSLLPKNHQEQGLADWADFSISKPLETKQLQQEDQEKFKFQWVLN